MSTTRNFWATIEVDCWSRGLSYEDYRKYHTLNATGAALSKEGYFAFCATMDAEQELSNN